MRAVTTGMIATYPVGGVAWDYGQYALGLERLGFEVYYLEDTGLPSHTLNPATGEYEEDPSYGIRFLRDSLAGLSPSLKERWHFRAYDDRTYGLNAGDIAEICAGADVLLNVSGGCLLRDEYRRCPRKVFIDTDPGLNHFLIFPRWDAWPEGKKKLGFRSHDHFFTFAGRIGQPDCPLPDFGLDWHPTVHPVVSDCWGSRDAPSGDRWTTVMMWKNYEKPIEHDGASYGSKEVEFAHVEEMPSRARTLFEIAVSGEAPRERLKSLGWSVAEGSAASGTANDYRSYIEGSRGEFSVAKNVYVATRSGWFSGRSACYLAARRPVVLQETGFSDTIATGDGLLSFSNLDEAVRAVDAVERDYDHHSEAARELACARLDSSVVLGEILGRIGLG